MKKNLVVQALVILLFASSAFGQDRYSDRWELGAQLGGLLVEGDSELEPHLQSGGRVGYNLDSNVSGEFSLLVGSADVKDNSDDATTYLPTTEALYNFGGDDDLRPFLAGGIGAFASDGPPGSNETDVVFPFGGGLKWMLSDHLMTRADVRWVINTAGGHDLHQGYYTIGLSWLFDGPTRAKTAAVESPVAAPKESRGKFSEAAKTLERDRQVSLRLLVQFDTGKTDIQPQYREHLLDVAAFINEHANTITEIEGHTDNVASKKYNQGLSLRRAQAVRHFLITQGKVNPSKLIAKGYWFSRPVSTNKTEEGRALNRRVIATIRATGN